MQTHIEHLKKENIDLKSKAKVTKLPESTKKTQSSIEKLNENIQEHIEAIKSLRLTTWKNRTITKAETPLRELRMI